MKSARSRGSRIPPDGLEVFESEHLSGSSVFKTLESGANRRMFESELRVPDFLIANAFSQRSAR
jgi:hypothetical protein